ncbi:HsdM family class I SAM-dependent methyltransferase [Rhizobium laguerreae]|uniref:site-specific DNA-methyltransferase (adenine-specific) n=1 Tax=Rhizobium laguerreae TaxID=1076926 RepID=A0A6N9ZNB8_9HYPH|nr:N-6 DNA methylase [Rhizobium laguerreae]NEH94973.1 N-6 DNA methylase [Rhizobium laguerreae]
MTRVWSVVHTQLRQETNARDARRLANLALAAHLISIERERKIDGHSLRDFIVEMSTLVEGHTPAGTIDLSLASRIANALQQADPIDIVFDTWVEAFQASDEDRKSLGAFSTPRVFADCLASSLLNNRQQTLPSQIIDPACGAGGLLIAVYRNLISRGASPEDALRRLHGLELDPISRELCILHIWLTAPAQNRPPLQRISSQIHLGNAITHNWFERGNGYDAVIMNPPWDSLRHKHATKAGEEVRAATLSRLQNPQKGASGLPLLYSAQGKGDKNLFKAFVELAPHLLKPGGRVAALIPAAFGSDLGMSDLRRLYLESLSIEKWTTFENRQRHFLIDSRYKFGILTATRSERSTHSFDSRSFCDSPSDVLAPHIQIDRENLKRLGGRDLMFPELSSTLERDLLSKFLSGSPLFAGGPLGTVKYSREVDLTLGKARGRFIHVDAAVRNRNGQPTLFSSDDADLYTPVLEGRMVGHFDCFQKSYVSGNGRSAVWENNTDRSIASCRSQYISLAKNSSRFRIAICDITSATNTRTVMATFVPQTWTCGNTAPVLSFGERSRSLAALMILNSLCFDWMARRIVSGLHLNKFYLETMCWPDVDERALSALAEMAEKVCHLLPRSGIDQRPPNSCELPDAALTHVLASAEVLIARSYGLSEFDLQVILSNNKADRRGFWRYFNAGGDKVRQAILDIIGVANAELAA